MKLIDQQKSSFSFRYEGTPLADLAGQIQVMTDEQTDEVIRLIQTRYILPDGLEITRTQRLFIGFDAVEQVLSFKNQSCRKSGLITELMDTDLLLALAEDPTPVPGWRVSSGHTRIISTTGSDCTRREFYPEEQVIRDGQTFVFEPSGGRSSSKLAPFFEISQDQHGWLCAIGWTGQWQVRMSRNETGVRLQSGIGGVAFRLLPGEQIRTSSCLLIPYSNGTIEAHNVFRRLMKQHFSLIGQPGRPGYGPLCCMSWGSVPSKEMIRRIERMGREQFGFEYFWIDAGWYGASDGYCPSEFEGDWYTQTGHWQVNPRTHPDGLRDVSAALQKQGMKLLLWIEPERAISSNPLPLQHPDWFLKLPEDTGASQNWLLDLGNPEARAHVIELVSQLVRKLDLGCYRQDFNCDPLPYWHAHDGIDRKGMTQIKHIMGLYELWDTLLNRFPNLIIDNCASGGRRIDIETMRRSMPLWRSDYQCVWDYEPEVSQMHSMGYASWLPWSSTGVGRVMGDIYRFRSSYGGGLVASYWGYEDREISDSQPLEWIRRSNTEYKRVRPYFSADFYPLSARPEGTGNWVAWQYDRPCEKDGIVQVFRQPDSPCVTARLEPGGLAERRMYTFEDADSGEKISFDSEELKQHGFNVQIAEKRSCRLYFYSYRDID